MTHHDPYDTNTTGTGGGTPGAAALPAPAGAGRPRSRNGCRALALLSVASLGSALLAGCGGSSSGSTTSVTIGVGGNIFDLPIRLADSNGYFAKQGLKVKFVTLTAATGTSALESGSVQFLNDSPTDFLSAVGKHVAERAISEDGGGNPLGLIVSTKFAKDHGLTSSSPASDVAKALDGSTGGASSANTKGEASVFLKAYGVDSGKVKWVSLPSPAADKAALKSNQIDWFVTSEPTPLEIQDAGDGVVVADPVKVPAWSAEQAGYGQVVVARTSYLGGHAATAKKVAAAVQEATAYMNAHVDGPVVQAVARKSLPGVSAPILKASLELVDWPVIDTMTAADWNKTLAFINSLQALPEKARISSGDWTNTYLS
jgi:NitT/TauT family transport system substrate-binding protein